MKNSRQLHRILERLEDRVLFDAVPDGGFLVHVEEPVESMAQNRQQLEQVTALHEESDQPRELILIDANVEDADQLLDEILSQRADRLFEVQLISADEDGLDQISALLDKAENPYEAIHILSHGNQGSIQLGSSLLTTESLTNYAGEIAGWTDALTADADLMFYGCNLGASDSGQEFMEMMSVLSGADVAASSDLTGNSDLGGDWELEA